MTKAVYTAPALRAHGHVESITKQSTGGQTLDGAFDAGTPLNQLTTS